MPGAAASGSLLLGPCLILLLVVWPAVEAFVNSPKIISKDGNLIFESGANRNISFRLSGNSRLTINEEYDVLELLLASAGSKKRPNGSNKDEWSSTEDFVDIRELADQLTDFQRRAFGANGLKSMLQQQLNRTRGSRVLLRRYQIRLRAMENKVNRLETQLELNSCQSGPCENGGSCYNTFSGYRCQCRPSFEGAKCEIDVNECALYEGTDLACQNGAQCLNQFGSYSCLCLPGWHGMHCTQRKGDCTQASAWELCGHGACVPSSDEAGYRCLCTPGWKTNGLTPVCGEDVDECSDTAAHTPCSTKCINLPGSFTCAPCAVGLTGNGISCRDLNECETNNGGCSLNPRVDCLNTYGSHHCGECPVGWTGDGRTCERNSPSSSGSSSNPGNSELATISSCAQRGSICHPAANCFEISGTVVCSCPSGMVGPGYGANGCVNGTVLNCKSNPCLNNGICLDGGPANFTCLCNRGFRPPLCEPLPNPCDAHPCKNGGRCNPTLSSADGFVCQCLPGYRDRLCATRFSSCNALLSAASGRLRYPPEGIGYEHNAQCAWVIRTNESLVLNVTFSTFDLEDSTECRFDWLQVNDGRSAAAQIIGRYCGNHLPHGGNIISSGNQLYLWFRSDNSTSREGFDLSWVSMQPQCGGRLEFESYGTLASPGSPGNYPRNRDCRWHLVAPTSKRIKLTFFSLQLEQHTNCNFDYVEIRDSISNRELAKFCSSGQPAPLLLPTHEAIIQFHSDADGSDSGFQLHYSVEERVPGCGGTYTSPEGSIRSSSLTSDVLMSCEYEIRLAIGELVGIDFVAFEMGRQDCLELYDVTELGSSLLQAKHCGETPGIPPNFRSLFNRVRIKAYAVRGRFELHYRTLCSYTFDSDSGTVLSPGYPNLTTSDTLCTYTISTAPNKLIVLNRLDFQLNDGLQTIDDVDEDDACLGTSLRINAGINRQILGPYCGKHLPDEEFISRTNHLILQLQTDRNSRGRGFKFEYQTVAADSDHCGGVHTKEGRIRLPVSEDGHYDNDLTCYWVIQAPARKVIRLHWMSFQLESSSDCSYDRVEIFDSMDAYKPDAKPLVRYCSAALPEDFVTQARLLTIKFVSDYSSGYDGFEVEYSFVDTDSCGGHIHASSGELLSPGYPMNYSADLDCDWHLTVGIGHLVEVQLEIFDLESSANCSRDYLEVRNGGDLASPLIGRFCGSRIPTRIPSFSNELRLHFHTDAAISGHGFRLRWRVFASGCGGRLSSNDGVITSPRYPSSYPHNAHCEWQVRVHPGSGVQLLIEDMELESSDDCSYDNVKIFMGARYPGYEPMLKICDLPEESQRVVRLDDNEVTIAFNSDVNNAMRGFRISYTTNCRRNVTATYGTIESLNFMEPYWDQVPINCSWTIRAPSGNRIRLEVSHLERQEERVPTALPGGVYLIDGATLLPLLGPGAHNASGDVLTVVHNASNVNFQLEYRIDGCLQEFRAESGSFQSPNHPGMYPNNLECYWLINVQMGETIELTVNNLDLEESVNCSKDALTVSNHMHEVFAHERHCGSTSQLILTSAGHRMHIRFIADGEHNGRGFEATYRTVRSTCGGKLSGRNGVIQSPNYPMPYPEQSHCEWLVEVSPHHRIVFDVQDMDIESGYDCSWDYLEAFDTIGGDEDAEGQRIFKLCDTGASHKRMSASNTAIVRFVSDDSISRPGFRLHFHESCGQQITIDDTDSEYLSLERQAPRNETCLWVLQASDPGKHIIFTATSIKLRPEVDSTYPKEGDCMPVGVKVYDGPEATGTPRLQFCRSHPPAIISHGQSLTISLPLLLVEEFEGHFMTMDTVCGSLYASISGRFSTPYYPDSYPPNIDCVWVLAASEGNSLSLTIESMDLEQSDGCNRDYLEVREKFERGPLIGVYCGNQVPGVIHSRGSIWMKFKSDDDNVGEGFMASYNYERHNELNGTAGVVTSPQYPSKFQTSDPYSWRITVDKNYVVMITIEHLRDLDQPHLSFYDGYSDIGARLETEVGDAPIRSSTNMVYFTASRGPFKLNWQQLSKESLRSNRTAEEQTRHCGQQLLSINQTMFTLNSPGYPGGYENGLQCAWTLVPVNTAMHAVFQLAKLDLEVYGSGECIADYLQISQSSDMQTWTEQAKLCAEPNNTATRIFHGNPYLKVEFITDASVNQTGFNGLVRTECGSELSASRGVINITDSVRGSPLRPQECVWKLRVRQGRRIRIDFPEFQLDNANGASAAPPFGSGQLCGTFLMVRNGDAADSPFLGRGKYCDSGNTDVLETTSNRAYIKFRYQGYPRFRVTFRFEELGHACSGRIVLGPAAGEQQVITSPNYPNLPNPHSECVWLISAPPQHRISVQFFGNFDLTAATGAAGDAAQCDREFIQMNDGSTELKPELGRFCDNRKPNTIYSSGSQLRIRYYTEVPEPLHGFQARLSIARCGGSYFSPEGEFSSPTPEQLQLHTDQGMTLEECVYTIEVEKGNTIELESERLQLPAQVAGNCSQHTHVRLEEIEAYGLEGEERIIDTLLVCGTHDRRLLVETNKIVVRLRLIDGNLKDNEGFRFRYKAIGSRCGEKIEAMQGVLQSPGYPDGVTHPMHCVWRLEVPKGRRVRVEILDFDTGGGTTARGSPVFRGRLTFANDHKMQSILGRYTGDPPAEIISSDNTMGIDAFLLPFSRHRGFKLRFSAHGVSECRRLNLLEGGPWETLNFERPNLTSLVHCSYNLTPPPNSTLLIQVLKYNTSSVIMRNQHICGLLSPLKLSRLEQSEPLLSHILCGFESIAPGDNLPTVRVPFPIQMTVSASVRNELRQLRLGYSMQSCGGIWPLEPGDNLTIREPFGMRNVAGAIDCAWAIGPDMDASGEDGPSSQVSDIQLEVSLTVNLPNAAGAGAGAGGAGDCHKQFLKVYNGPDQNSPSLGTYCDQASAVNLVVERGLFLEYHADRYEANSTFNVSIKYGSGCGGKLSYPYRHVEFSEQYKNNVECVWEVESSPGYHIGLSFQSRFYIEDSTGCTKDYLLVQQRNDSAGNWTDLQRICGRAPPQQINTTTPFMRLIFRSDGDVVGDGFVAKFERNCGGTLYATDDEQELTSPGYPGYEHNLKCSWTFVPQDPHAAGVLVSFLQFDLEQAPINVCPFDNVTVVSRDGGDHVQQATICGVKHNHEYRAKQSIDLTLRTDSSYNGRGFRLVYSTRLCGGVISETGAVASPRQHTDNMLPPSSDCYWNLTAPEGHKFTIRFELIDFEAHSNCAYDGVEVFAGAVPNERMRAGRFCGRITEDLPTISIGSQRALIHSFSDERDPSRGFRALVRVLRNCDEHIRINGSSRYVFSKFHSQEGYEHNLDCNIVFNAPADQQLSLEFPTFHVEQGDDCGKDFVELRDGAGPFSELIGKFCGQDQPPTITTSRHTLFLRFFTNSAINDAGFELTVSSKPRLCGSPEIKLESAGLKQTTLSSPSTESGGNYDNGVACFWKIVGDAALNLQFISFDLEGPDANGSCVADYLKIYNTEDALMVEQGYGSELIFNGHTSGSNMMNYATEHVYCGAGKPDTYYANAHEVYVKFRTNGAVTRPGFQIRVSLDSDCQRHYSGLQGRVRLSETSDCDVYIRAPANYTLSLYQAELVFGSFDCDQENMQVFDRNNQSLQRICSYVDAGKSLFSQTNELRLHIKTGSYLSTLDLTFLASPVEAGPGCGGQLYNTEGIFTNPFYPENVRNNSDCRWTIQVPSNNRVLLFFETFDLGSRSTCHTDYLQILEKQAGSGEEREMRRFCGDDAPRVYKSDSSKLVVRFHKTVNYDGVGWVIKFSSVYSNYQIPAYML
ncbi:cubilin homolog [Drosophila madeirensis]|uniref:Cubilin homolog n=1 Tax=Drosophila madeirensis TaxID=30013 RepID=A0AAU9G152_DROMD